MLVLGICALVAKDNMVDYALVKCHLKIEKTAAHIQSDYQKYSYCFKS